jgi:argininosuccinate lyase
LSWIGLREGRLRTKLDPDDSNYIYGRRMKEQKEIFDIHMWIHKAHVIMLAENGTIPLDQTKQILKALREIKAEDIEFDPRLEDLYTNVERYLIGKIGDVAGAMHTGRSRNDLSATVSRMRVREKIEKVIQQVQQLQSTLLEKARDNVETIMPGYTHLQQAQPITLAHWLMAYHDFLRHDIERLEDARKRTYLSPLGSAALAGTGHRIDRFRTAELLCFDGIVENSLQCVSTRDFILEAVFDLTLMMNTVERMNEDIYLWVTDEFKMVELDDAFAGTSSIMPQKKNPLLQETIRARSAIQIGRLTASVTVLKALPMGHNFDSHELDPILNDSVDELLQTLHITDRTISTLKINKDRMSENLGASYIIATELADVMVKEAGIPFRAAHQVTGRIVRKAIERVIKASDITLELIQEASREVLGKELSLTEKDVVEAIDPRLNVERRKSTGGPSPVEVSRMIHERIKEAHLVRGRQMKRQEGYAEAKAKTEQEIEKLLKN